MQAKTHMIGGAASAAALCLANDIGIVQAIPMATVGAIGGLFPDIDVPGSYLSRTSLGVRSMSGILTLIFGHRGFFHSLIFTGFTWLVLKYMCVPRFEIITSEIPSPSVPMVIHPDAIASRYTIPNPSLTLGITKN